MLPETIVGTVITSSGKQPFQLDGATGKVTLGRYASAHRMQRSIGPMERTAIDTQVRDRIPDAREVRIGEYACTRCGRWVDVADDPDAWDGDRCARCG